MPGADQVRARGGASVTREDSCSAQARAPTAGTHAAFAHRRARPPCHRSLLFYAVAVAWHFLFPLVNVSGGEAKPRGTFIAEHGIMQGTVDAGFGADDVRAGGWSE